jgi:hypothetical protein
MQPFLSENGREFYIVVLNHPGAFELPFKKEAHPCLIWDTQGGWSDEERTSLTTALLDNEVRYAVCGGVDCERWHDELDEALVHRYLDDERAADEHFVMTTWHTDEPPAEVAFFLAHSTNFEHYDFQRYVLVQLGGGAEWTARLKSALTLAVRQPERLVDEHPEAAG